MTLMWGILFGFIAAFIALAKKRNVVLWFIAGFIIQWLAVILLLILPGGSHHVFSGRRGESGSRTNTQWRSKVSRECPYCGHQVAFDDIPGNWTCPNCGQTFTYSTDGRVYRQRDERLMPQIEWIVKLFAKIAKKDGVVSENEVRQVDQIVRQAFQPTRQQLQQIMTLFNQSRYSDESVESIAQNLYASVRGRRDILADTLTALVAIAAADGMLRPEEEATIRTIAAIFGLADEYESLKSQFFGRSSQGNTEQSMGIDACYRLLGCRQDDSDQVIKKKYRALIKENHPDRLMSRGASEASIKEANNKIAEIKRAYERIMAARA
ncbi:TerB family tellurite resistance protein [Sporolactobacillus sp. CPB3-1]|uniref:TerB family tellurite resistance protein n=1 Tax=Sporolactobacillus mangiferae TaxID=2940498 RepID=A0ABT0M953_9BACL|nr:TerB family tellurite resistance protein [Sporolactobacillus mangiferae]MCL1631391.1 TerB family tellurite resistance protein [Sporolactobacillus mangiferae]